MNTTFKTSMEAFTPKEIPHSSVENKAEMLLSSSSSPPPPPVSSPPSQPIKNEKKSPTTHQFIPPPQTNSPPSSGDAPVQPPPPPPPIKCPRCDSPDTKFCYYNNYSLTQPRHYCRTCRRYWTKGGALRNIPFGGSCKKRRSRSSATSLELLTGEDSDSPKLFQGTLSPTMSFHLETTLSHFPNPKIPSPNLSSFGDHPNLIPPMGGPPYILESSLNSSKVTEHSYLRCGITNSNMSMIGPANHSLGEMNSTLISGGGKGGSSSLLAPPMESLSSLHWKLLQHQRMAMLYGGGEIGINLNGYLKEEVEMLPLTPAEAEKPPQPILFRNIMEVKSGPKLENDHDQYNHHGSATAGYEDRGKGVDASGWLFGGGNHGGGGDDEENDGNKCIVNNNIKNGSSSGGGGQGWPPDQRFNGST